tara:strand:- start:27 stop:287 length:261 start_codon:yes stop_codon:yes gene_type:complete
MKEEIKDKDNIISSVHFLVLKIERNISEIKLGVSKSKRAELFKYQDRLMDSLMEESEKIRQTKDLEQIEDALSKLKFLRREATSGR